MKSALLAIAFSLAPALLLARPSVSTTTLAQDDGITSSVTVAIDCSGTDRVLAVGHYWRRNSNQNTAGITHDGVDLSTGTQLDNGRGTIIKGILVAPGTGSKNVVASVSADVLEQGVIANCVNDAAQTDPARAEATHAAVSSSPHDVDATSDSDDLILDIHTNNLAATATAGTGQTILDAGTLTDGHFAMSSKDGASSTTNMEWSWSGGSTWNGLLAFAIKPAAAAPAAAGGATPQILILGPF